MSRPVRCLLLGLTVWSLSSCALKTASQFTDPNQVSVNSANPNYAKPNVILFLVDDLGVMDTSEPMLIDQQGNSVRHPLNDYYQTPHIEQLAKQGVKLTRFYAHSVCSPTRSSIFTGQNSARHKTTQWIKGSANNRGEYGPHNWNWLGLDKRQANLLSMFNKQGYQTIHIGKGHFGPIGSEGEFPEQIGFDVNIAGASFGQPGSYYGQHNFGELKGNKNFVVPHLERYYGQDVHLNHALTLEATSAMTEAVNQQQPFFLYMSHYGVHYPFHADQRFIKPYAEDGEVTERDKFASMVAGVDQSLGDLIAKLNELDQADNTLILFLGDNGTDAPLDYSKDYPFKINGAAPLRGIKATAYEGGMRVPFVAAWGKQNQQNPWQQQLAITAGSADHQVSSIFDIYPTLAQLLGVEVTSQIDGETLAPQFAGKAQRNNQSFLNHFPHNHRSSYFTSYVQGDWKLIYYYPVHHIEWQQQDPNRLYGEKQIQLFNLAEDQSESVDLAQKHPTKVEQLFNDMMTELVEKQAQFPIKDNKALRPSL